MSIRMCFSYTLYMLPLQVLSLLKDNIATMERNDFEGGGGILAQLVERHPGTFRCLEAADFKTPPSNVNKTGNH